jgi:hypothetical protein
MMAIGATFIVERLANRIVLGILGAAFISRTATLLSVNHPPGWERMGSWIYAIGFGLATVLGVLIAWSIMRPRDRWDARPKPWCPACWRGGNIWSSAPHTP